MIHLKRFGNSKSVKFELVPIDDENDSDFGGAADKSVAETDQPQESSDHQPLLSTRNKQCLILVAIQFIILMVMLHKIYRNMLKNGLLNNEPSNNVDIPSRPSSTLRPYTQPEVCPNDYWKAITSKRGDGFGAQLEGMMSVWLYAQMENKTYCTRPWDIMAHNISAIEMFEFVGGIHYGPLANKDTHTAIEKTKLWKEVELETVFQAWKFARRNYLLGPKPELVWFKNDLFNIALHVRRGDVSKAKIKTYGLDMYRRYRGNNAYIKCMKALSERYRDVGKPLAFHIFSEGEMADFQSIIDEFPDAIFHLDGDIKLTHYHMVMADALVTAISSFSRTAGFLSTNDVYYLEGRGIAKYGNWIGCQSAGSMRRVMASLIPYDLSTMISL